MTAGFAKHVGHLPPTSVQLLKHTLVFLWAWLAKLTPSNCFSQSLQMKVMTIYLFDLLKDVGFSRKTNFFPEKHRLHALPMPLLSNVKSGCCSFAFRKGGRGSVERQQVGTLHS